MKNWKLEKGERFWNICLDGDMVRPEWGKKGGKAQGKTKFYERSALAKAAVEKQVAAKVREGFVVVKAPKVKKPKVKVPPPSLDDSAIFKRLSALREQEPQWKTALEHYTSELFVVGDYILVTCCTAPPLYSKEPGGTTELLLLSFDAEGLVIEDRLTIENNRTRMAFLHGGRLTLLLDRGGYGNHEYHWATFDQIGTGKLGPVTEKKGGAMAEELGKRYAKDLVIARDLLLAAGGEKNHDLCLYRISKTGFDLTLVGQHLMEFGESLAYGDNRGYGSIGVRGNRAILSGKDWWTGFKLVEFDPKDGGLRELATHKGKQGQENIVRFVHDNLCLGFGAYAKAQFFEIEEGKQKLRGRGTIATKAPWGLMYAEGNEVLLFSDDSGSATDSGMVLRIEDDKPMKVGELDFPFPVRRILVQGDRVVLLGVKQIASYKAGLVIAKAKVPPKRKRTKKDRHWVTPSDQFKDSLEGKDK